MTFTPSRMACCTAAAESLVKQPSKPHTLYTATCARGATPETRPRGTPNRLASTRAFPAAVLEVCVP
jgi:hypothetical protein